MGTNFSSAQGFKRGLKVGFETVREEELWERLKLRLTE